MTSQDLAELYLLSRSLWWRHELGLLSDEAVSELVKVLRSARSGIVAQIEAEAQGLASISEWTRERNDQISAWIDEVLAGTSASVTSYISEASVGVALASVATYNSILSFDGKAKAVKLVEGLTREQVKQFFQDQPLGGKLLSDWVGNAFSTGARDSILDAIREGVVLGEGYRKLVKRVMAAADAGFSITQREATTLVRTYVQSANTGAQEAVYEQNEGIIKGYKRVETLDTHTCRICALADGTVYGKNEKRPELPAHPNCRGIWVPVLKSFREVGLNIDELEEVARPWTIRGNWHTGKRGGIIHDSAMSGKDFSHSAADFYKIQNFGTTKENFGGWWESLSAEDKLKTSVGPVRGKLLEEGLVRWEDLSDKRTGLPYTLEQLGFDEQGNPLR